VSSVRIGEVMPYELYRGFVDLDLESPAPAKTLGAVELPDDTSNGPHFFYGLQWWFFGALAIFGFCYLVWDELRQRRVRRTRSSRSERPEHATVHGQHRPADEG
jgi:cytochrome oxidase assembly protein ShyY1